MSAAPKTEANTRKNYRGRLARNMLLTFLPLTLIPVFLTGIIGLSRLYMLLRDQTLNRISSDTVNTSLNITARANASQAFLEKLAEDSRFWPMVESAMNVGPEDSYFPSIRSNIIREFKEISALQPEPYFEQFMVVSPDGRVLLSSDDAWEMVNLSNSSLKSLLNQQKTEGFIINNPVYANGYRVYTSQPVLQNNVHTATIIGIGNQALLLRDIGNATITDPSVRAYFYTSQGDLLILNQEKTELINIAPGEQFGSYLKSTVTNETVLRLEQYPSLGNIQVFGMMLWNEGINTGLITELPQFTLLNNLLNLLPLIAGMLVFMMVMVGFVVSLITRRIVKPIIGLSENAELFAEGDWSRRSIVERDDELGMLGNSFNRMADDLESLYRSLEWKVEERSRQIRMASEVAQAATSAPHMKELLRRTVNLIIERFSFYDASIFLIDDTGVYAVLEEAAEKVQHSRKEGVYRLAVGSRSLIGWAAANNQPRISNTVQSDPLYLKDELLPNTRAEVVIPISIGDTVLGVLDVQSDKENAFNQEDITILQTITNLIATAIRNIRLLEGTEINLEEASLLYNASRQITKAATTEEIFEVAARSIHQSSFINALLMSQGDRMKLVAYSGMEIEDQPKRTMDFSSMEIEVMIPGADRYLIVDPSKTPTIPSTLRDMLMEWMVETAAFLPIRAGNSIEGLIVLASREAGTLTATSIQPYTNLVEMISTTIEKLSAQTSFVSQLNELQIINDVGRSVAAQTEVQTLIEAVHQGVVQAFGEVNFLIALYDSETKMIHVPYMADGKAITQVDPFPLGQGLTSIVIRNREPLLLKSIDENELVRLGAKLVGASAKSWLGVPLMVGNEVIGVMAVQDLERANRFNEDHVRLLTTLSAQIAVSIRNTMLLEQTRVTAERERLLHDLSSKIRGSQDIRRILETTATELGRALGARSARVEINMDTAIVEAGHNGGKEAVK